MKFKILFIWIFIMIGIICIVLYGMTLKKKSTEKKTTIVAQAQSSTNDINDVSFTPNKVGIKDNNNNIGTVKLTDYYFPPGTILLWTDKNNVPNGWELITIINDNYITGRIPIARDFNDSSIYRFAGSIGGGLSSNVTPKPTTLYPPYFTISYIRKKNLEV